MSFQQIERIVAFDSMQVGALLGTALEWFGETVPDGAESIRTIGAFWDDEGRTRIRAASLVDGTISGIPLADGRVAFQCLWQSDLVDAWQEGLFPGVVELTTEELSALRVVEVEP
ncbi:hypothetical protein TSACC_2903 [Terrimicrobium sacchariphilum]|jgi:hypothetical protein|uniref:Uncharacterized protein n=1 Tax=Terrimicrobium sacchariphilum TaxID=690879 RepID=A0A146G6D5_TERSA|nr:hypothetical protein [Terrimicrobium sacchariphilum]GAT32504.1 hypothetical protein TSACC_2903 [Terrimicrobium sacchariphilum]